MNVNKNYLTTYDKLEFIPHNTASIEWLLKQDVINYTLQQYST